MPKVTIHMVASLDGYIANDDTSFSWLQTNDSYVYVQGVEDPDVVEFVKQIDCYVIGARTYETTQHLGWPYGEVPTYVLSHHYQQAELPTIHFHDGNLLAFVNEKLKARHYNIWVVGGAMLVKECFRLDLVDEIRLTIAPILLGGGLPFFDSIGCQRVLHLKEVVPYKNGVVALWYKLIKPEQEHTPL